MQQLFMQPFTRFGEGWRLRFNGDCSPKAVPAHAHRCNARHDSHFCRISWDDVGKRRVQWFEQAEEIVMPSTISLVRSSPNP